MPGNIGQCCKHLTGVAPPHMVTSPEDTFTTTLAPGGGDTLLHTVERSEAPTIPTPTLGGVSLLPTSPDQATSPRAARNLPPSTCKDQSCPPSLIATPSSHPPFTMSQKELETSGLDLSERSSLPSTVIPLSLPANGSHLRWK